MFLALIEDSDGTAVAAYEFKNEEDAWAWGRAAAAPHESVSVLVPLTIKDREFVPLTIEDREPVRLTFRPVGGADADDLD
jgi:hypothetical protein